MDKLVKAMADYATSLKMDANAAGGEVAIVRRDLADKIGSWLVMIQEVQVSQMETKKADTPKVGTTGGTNKSESAKS